MTFIRNISFVNRLWVFCIICSRWVSRSVLIDMVELKSNHIQKWYPAYRLHCYRPVLSAVWWSNKYLTRNTWILYHTHCVTKRSISLLEVTWLSDLVISVVDLCAVVVSVWRCETCLKSCLKNLARIHLRLCQIPTDQLHFILLSLPQSWTPYLSRTIYLSRWEFTVMLLTCSGHCLSQD